MMGIRTCYICGKDISYSECINICIIQKHISINVHKSCLLTINDFTLIHKFINNRG